MTTASDIWSVGCLAIELLTGGCIWAALGYPLLQCAIGLLRGVSAIVPCTCLLCTMVLCECLSLYLAGTAAAGSPPYYDLQPLSALYNIVQVCFGEHIPFAAQLLSCCAAPPRSPSVPNHAIARAHANPWLLCRTPTRPCRPMCPAACVIFC